MKNKKAVGMGIIVVAILGAIVLVVSIGLIGWGRGVAERVVPAIESRGGLFTISPLTPEAMCSGLTITCFGVKFSTDVNKVQEFCNAFKLVNNQKYWVEPDEKGDFLTELNEFVLYLNISVNGNEGAQYRMYVPENYGAIEGKVGKSGEYVSASIDNPAMYTWLTPTQTGEIVWDNSQRIKAKVKTLVGDGSTEKRYVPLYFWKSDTPPSIDNMCKVLFPIEIQDTKEDVGVEKIEVIYNNGKMATIDINGLKLNGDPGTGITSVDYAVKNYGTTPYAPLGLYQEITPGGFESKKIASLDTGQKKYVGGTLTNLLSEFFDLTTLPFGVYKVLGYSPSSTTAAGYSKAELLDDNYNPNNAVVSFVPVADADGNALPVVNPGKSYTLVYTDKSSNLYQDYYCDSESKWKRPAEMSGTYANDPSVCQESCEGMCSYGQLLGSEAGDVALANGNQLELDKLFRCKCQQSSVTIKLDALQNSYDGAGVCKRTYYKCCRNTILNTFELQQTSDCTSIANLANANYEDCQNFLVAGKCTFPAVDPAKDIGGHRPVASEYSTNPGAGDYYVCNSFFRCCSAVINPPTSITQWIRTADCDKIGIYQCWKYNNPADPAGCKSAGECMWYVNAWCESEKEDDGSEYTTNDQCKYRGINKETCDLPTIDFYCRDSQNTLIYDWVTSAPDPADEFAMRLTGGEADCSADGHGTCDEFCGGVMITKTPDGDDLVPPKCQCPINCTFVDKGSSCVGNELQWKNIPFNDCDNKLDPNTGKKVVDVQSCNEFCGGSAGSTKGKKVGEFCVCNGEQKQVETFYEWGVTEISGGTGASSAEFANMMMPAEAYGPVFEYEFWPSTKGCQSYAVRLKAAMACNYQVTDYKRLMTIDVCKEPDAYPTSDADMSIKYLGQKKAAVPISVGESAPSVKLFSDQSSAQEPFEAKWAVTKMLDLNDLVVRVTFYCWDDSVNPDPANANWYPPNVLTQNAEVFSEDKCLKSSKQAGSCAANCKAIHYNVGVFRGTESNVGTFTGWEGPTKEGIMRCECSAGMTQSVLAKDEGAWLSGTESSGYEYRFPTLGLYKAQLKVKDANGVESAGGTCNAAGNALEWKYYNKSANPAPAWETLTVNCPQHTPICRAETRQCCKYHPAFGYYGCLNADYLVNNPDVSGGVVGYDALEFIAVDADLTFDVLPEKENYELGEKVTINAENSLVGPSFGNFDYHFTVEDLETGKDSIHFCVLSPDQYYEGNWVSWEEITSGTNPEQIRVTFPEYCSDSYDANKGCSAICGGEGELIGNKVGRFGDVASSNLYRCICSGQSSFQKLFDATIPKGEKPEIAFKLPSEKGAEVWISMDIIPEAGSQMYRAGVEKVTYSEMLKISTLDNWCCDATDAAHPWVPYDQIDEGYTKHILSDTARECTDTLSCYEKCRQRGYDVGVDKGMKEETEECRPWNRCECYDISD